MATYLREFCLDKRVLFLSFAFVVYAVVIGLTPASGWTWLAVGVGIFFFFFVEYITHRFILHGFFASFMPKAFQGHVDHHDDPDNLVYMLTPNSYNVPLHLLFWGVFSLATWSVHTGSAVMLGLCGYQLYYEWTHFISHRAIVPMTPWGKKMKKFHLLHHYKHGDYWYGVTNSFADSLVGTNPEPAQIQTDKTRLRM